METSLIYLKNNINNKMQCHQYQSYQLHISLEKETRISIGKLGGFLFPAGYYIYTGSAKKNIEARVQRHRSDNKKKHWHIDYFLLNPHSKITSAFQFNDVECKLNQLTAGKIVAPGFGATDCKSKCNSHFKYLGQDQTKPAFYANSPLHPL